VNVVALLLAAAMLVPMFRAGAVSLCFSNPEDCMRTGSVQVLIWLFAFRLDMGADLFLKALRFSRAREWS
jgi:hypothetical protein